MKIFEKKKRKNNKEREYIELYSPREIYLLTTKIISDCDDGSGAGSKVITQYYLATKKDEKFYEFFSKVQIKTGSSKQFNVPRIKKVEEFKEYVEYPDALLTAEHLFYFITKKNAELMVKGKE